VPVSVIPLQLSLAPSQRNLGIRVERTDVRPRRGRILRGIRHRRVVRVLGVGRPRVVRQAGLVVDHVRTSRHRSPVFGSTIGGHCGRSSHRGGTTTVGGRVRGTAVGRAGCGRQLARHSHRGTLRSRRQGRGLNRFRPLIHLVLDLPHLATSSTRLRTRSLLHRTPRAARNLQAVLDMLYSRHPADDRFGGPLLGFRVHLSLDDGGPILELHLSATDLNLRSFQSLAHPVGHLLVRGLGRGGRLGPSFGGWLGCRSGQHHAGGREGQQPHGQPLLIPSHEQSLLPWTVAGTPGRMSHQDRQFGARIAKVSRPTRPMGSTFTHRKDRDDSINLSGYSGRNSVFGAEIARLNHRTRFVSPNSVTHWVIW